MDSAQPSVYSVELDIVCPAIENILADFSNPNGNACEVLRGLSEIKRSGILDMQEGTMSAGHLLEDSEEREISHEERILRLLHGEEQLDCRKRIVLTRYGEDLSLGTRQSAA